MIILRIVREALGRVVIFFDWISRPRKAVRSADEQAQVAEKTRHLSLYQFYACPFCVKTRRALHRLNLPIELRDAQKRDGQHRADLLEGGGRVKVPCLRIESAEGDEWIFRSDEIIAYLEEQYA